MEANPVHAHVAKLWSLEPKARVGDPEAVHDMRVSTRRIRTTIWAFGGQMEPQITALAPELRWLGRVLGLVRDLDVQIDSLRKRVAEDGFLAPFVESATHDRQVAFQRLNEALDSPRFGQLMQSLTQAATAVQIPRVAGDAALNRAIEGARKAAAKVEVGAPDVEFHRLRKRVKRLRYVVEAVSPPWEEAAVKRLKKLQEKLGTYQDRVTEHLMLSYWLRPPELSPETVSAGERRLRKLDRKWHSRQADVVDCLDVLDADLWNRI